MVVWCVFYFNYFILYTIFDVCCHRIHFIPIAQHQKYSKCVVVEHCCIIIIKRPLPIFMLQCIFMLGR